MSFVSLQVHEGLLEFGVLRKGAELSPLRMVILLKAQTFLPSRDRRRRNSWCG